MKLFLFVLQWFFSFIWILWILCIILGIIFRSKKQGTNLEQRRKFMDVSLKTDPRKFAHFVNLPDVFKESSRLSGKNYRH